MKLLWQVSLVCLLVGGIATAQRGGGMRGGGMLGGVGGGRFGGFRGGFIGGINVNGSVGPIRAVLVGVDFPHGAAFPSNGLGFPSTNVSFPFGLGFPATPLGFGNNVGFFNGFGFRNFNNRPFFNGGLGNGPFNGLGGLGFGISDIGAPFPDSSYFPVYQYAPSQPLANAALIYTAEPIVQPLSAERAHPVIHEYDQSGKEIRPVDSLSPSVAVIYPPEPAAQPFLAERARPVIHEYDQSGKEIRLLSLSTP